MNPNYRLYTVRVFSYAWDAALAFYRDTLQFPLAFADETLGWAQFDLGGCHMGLERCDPEDPEAAALVGRFVGVSIAVNDIDAVYDALCERGVHFVAPPAGQPWGGVLAHLEDPDGNVLTLLGGVGG